MLLQENSVWSTVTITWTPRLMHISKLDTRQSYQTEISLFQQCGSPNKEVPIEHVSVCAT